MNITHGEGTGQSRTTAPAVAVPLVSCEGIAPALRLQELFAAIITCLVFRMNRNPDSSKN